LFSIELEVEETRGREEIVPLGGPLEGLKAWVGESFLSILPPISVWGLWEGYKEVEGIREGHNSPTMGQASGLLMSAVESALTMLARGGDSSLYSSVEGGPSVATNGVSASPPLPPDANDGTAAMSWHVRSKVALIAE